MANEKHVSLRLPESVLATIDNLVTPMEEALKATPLGADVKFNRSLVMRLALIEGLQQLAVKYLQEKKDE